MSASPKDAPAGPSKAPTVTTVMVEKTNPATGETYREPLKVTEDTFEGHQRINYE